MRANRERGEHGTENASSCSGPNGELSEARSRVARELDRILERLTPAIDWSQAEPEIDVSRYAVGVALSEKLLVVACPVCGASAIKRSRHFAHTYVHRLVLTQRTALNCDTLTRCKVAGSRAVAINGATCLVLKGAGGRS